MFWGARTRNAGVSRHVEWSDSERSRENGEFDSSFHCRQHGAVRGVTLWGMRGVRVGEASHPGPRFSRRSQNYRSRSRSVGRVGGGQEDSRLLSCLTEGSLPPTPSVLAVAPRPIEVVIQESGSSDGDPLVRPNNGRDVSSGLVTQEGTFTEGSQPSVKTPEFQRVSSTLLKRI